jgi:CRP/FNR family transcriptional regulator, cyclic AMP receptor protein
VNTFLVGYRENHEPLENLTMVEINIFKHSPDAVTIEAGAILFRDGDEGDVMFAVVEGEIELLRDGTTFEIVGPGGILGELALIDPAPRSAAARARTQARVVSVDKKQFTFLVHEHPTFALQVMTIMAERIRQNNASLRSRES